MAWQAKYHDEALGDLDRLDASVRSMVLKGIKKVLVNPLPRTDGGYGRPLHNHNSSKLAGYCSIKFSKLGLRVVYRPAIKNSVMYIVVISVRADGEVYTEAEKRLKHDPGPT